MKKVATSISKSKKESNCIGNRQIRRPQMSRVVGLFDGSSRREVHVGQNEAGQVYDRSQKNDFLTTNTPSVIAKNAKD